MNNLLKKYGIITGLLVSTIGIMVMIGWLLHIRWVLSVLPGLETMKWNTALGFMIGGVLIAYSFSTYRKSIGIFILALPLLLFGLLQVYQYIVGSSLGIDELFVKDYIARRQGSAYPGRMAFGTALSFLLLGVAYLFTAFGQWSRKLAAVLFHVVILLALLSVLGYLYDVPVFHKLAFITSMALHTSVCFLLLAVFSCLLVPQWGVLSLFLGNKVGQLMARQLFPLLTLLLFLLGFVWIKVYQKGLFKADFGISIFVLLFMLIGLLMIWLTARSLNKIDNRRQRAEDALRQMNTELELKVHQRTAALTQANAELERSNRRNRIFVNQAPNAIAMFDLDMKYIAASQQWYQDYGLEGRQIIGKSHYDIFPEISEKWKAIHKQCLAGEVNRCEEAEFIRRDGSAQWLKWEVRPWYINEHEIGGLLMYTEDITPQKLKERETRRIEEILNKTSDIAKIGTWSYHVQTGDISWDRITHEIHETPMGYEPHLDTAILFYEEGTHRETIRTALAKAVETGEPFDHELIIHTSAGHKKWVRAIGQATFQGGTCTRLFGLFQDIDEVRKAQAELSRVNQELTAILDSGTHVAIIGTDLSGTITHFGKGAETLLGYTASEMVGKQTPLVFHHPEEIEARALALFKEENKSISSYELFTEAIKAGGYDNREWTYVAKDGHHFTVQLVITGIRAADGELIGYLGIATDISELKEKETRLQEVNKNLEELAAELTLQNRQLADFAQITSHNLRAPVSNLLTLLKLYTKAEDDEKYVLMEKFNKVSHHLSQTLDDLMEALRIQQGASVAMESIRFEDVMEKTRSLLSAQLMEHDVALTHSFDEAPEIMYEPHYMDSIYLNLISNAIKYRSPHRPLHIKLKTVKSKEGIELWVEDNGLGINLKRHGPKVFGLHKTFHRNKDARGVGLFLTKTQVTAMGGTIEVQSKVDKGTRFVIKF